MSAFDTGVDPQVEMPRIHAKTELVETQVAGQVVRFAYPGALGLRPFVENVLNGQDYPIVFPGLFEAKTIVDIGAHAGAATIYLKGHYPEAEVFAFEPSRLAHAHLLVNVDGLPNVRVRKAALSDQSGEAKLYAGFYSSMQASIKPNEENDEAYEVVDLVDAGEALESLELEGISILKVDTEGCEVEILRAIARSLPSIDVIYLEYHSEPDRLEIERTLCPGFVLYAARADEVHRGTNTYVRAEVFERFSARQTERYVFAKA